MNKLVEKNMISGELSHRHKLDPHFEAWWKSYPTRIGSNPKNKARTAYLRAAQRYTPERLRIALTGYFSHLHETKTINTSFVMMATTFLNGRWEEWDNFGQPEKPKKPPYQPPVDNAKKMQLYRALGESDYRLWLDPCWVYGDELHVTSQLRADWIKEKFDGLLWKNGIKKVKSKSL
jgi:hypothetical protein